MEIYTPRVLEAVNGTDVRLKCTFSSFAPVGDTLTVTWNFRPRDGGSEQFVSKGPLVRKISQSISPCLSCIFLSNKHRVKLGNKSTDRTERLAKGKARGSCRRAADGTVRLACVSLLVLPSQPPCPGTK